MMNYSRSYERGACNKDFLFPGQVLCILHLAMFQNQTLNKHFLIEVYFNLRQINTATVCFRQDEMRFDGVLRQGLRPGEREERAAAEEDRPDFPHRHHHRRPHHPEAHQDPVRRQRLRHRLHPGHSHVLH